jgi:predicted nucleotidyltransferase component of viral defense system
LIDREEIRKRAEEWGTPMEQILRDHLISHLLHALRDAGRVVFFGGTALNRTFVEGRRLSEDIDLYLTHENPPSHDDVVVALQTGTEREFPELRVDRTSVTGDVANFSVTAAEASVRLQIVGPRHEDSRYGVAPWPVSLRYSDLPGVVDLCVPTVESFGAMKCAAFEDRHAPRDLFDLGSLVEIDAMQDATVEALRQFRGFGPVQWQYDDGLLPTGEEWRAELGHQTVDTGDPNEILHRVREALAITSVGRSE